MLKHMYLQLLSRDTIIKVVYTSLRGRTWIMKIIIHKIESRKQNYLLCGFDCILLQDFTTKVHCKRKFVGMIVMDNSNMEALCIGEDNMVISIYLSYFICS